MQHSASPLNPAPWWELSVWGKELGDDDLHHFFQAGLVRGLPVGLLPHVLVMGKVLFSENPP
jgi:hypothetical protein